MIKKIVTCFLLLVTSYLLLATSSVLAAEEFATNYDVTYDIAESGVTTVTEKVSLRNLTSQYYATQFKITIGATQITDVLASDASGALQTSIEQNDTSTSIGVKFNQQIAGINKLLPWTLQFKSNDFASKQGKIWNVSVPKVIASQNLEGYNLTISVPLSFGEPTLITPHPKSQSASGGKMYFVFDKDQLTSSGVSAEFGDNQLFNFDLAYNLENPGLVPLITAIALPPDTAFQDVTFQRIDPKPLNVTTDDDGNYLAWYKLLRNAKFTVKVVGSAKLYSSSKIKNPVLTKEQIANYTKSDKYWEKDNPNIKAKLAEIFGNNPPARQLVGGPVTNSEKAKMIHRYVVNLLKYDSSRLSSSGIERLGAATVLNNPTSAVCMEFTDLFIALARGAGVPARELDGFAYTSNNRLRPLSLSKDILHAWPEYFDPAQGWVMIDPTWENTTGGVDYFEKLDLNHFVFAIKGLSSQSPVPAGSYKFTGVESHDVKVSLSEVDFLGKPQLDVTVENSDPIIAGFPDRVNLKISNHGNAVYPGALITMLTRELNILNRDIGESGPIPAFGSASFELNIRTKTIFDNYDDVLKIEVGGQLFSKDLRIRPFIIFQSSPLALVLIIVVILIIYFAILGRFIYKRRVAKNSEKKAV